ncbi:MAG TPA: glycosyltransferase family 4 protein [Candidatus Saccharimonadales bacterium]|nr:glycosyltransferase family 4 protein [Candidatus Saccharimonadales bacterium]
MNKSLPKNAKSPRLKIGIVFDDSLDNPDGVQQYITTLGDWFTAHGHTVRYLVGETKLAATRNDIYSLARNVHIRFNKNRLSVPLPVHREAISAVLDREEFDVLHVQLPCSPMMGGRIVNQAAEGTVVVGTFHIVGHHWMVNNAARLLGLWQRRMMQRFDHLVGVSPAAQEFAIKHFAAKDCLVLPNVVERQRFAAAKPIPHLMDGKVNIVFLGRLVERKGCQYLIEAVRRLRDRGAADNLRVLICGKGPLEHSLKQRVRHYQLQDIISFVGFVSEEDKPNYLASAELAIFPSTGGESFGIVLLEAMAAGAGVVMGGDNEGYRTVLGPQANHLLFQPRHTQIFADKIQLLLSNKKLRLQLHAWQAKEIIQYDVETVAPKLLQLYSHK